MLSRCASLKAYHLRLTRVCFRISRIVILIMNFYKIRFVVSAITISLVLSEPQFGNYESFNVYEIDTNNGNPTSHRINPGQNYNNHRYQSNPLNNPLANSDFDSRNDQQSSTSCDSYWSYQTDYTEKFGIISIPNPDYQKSVIRALLSVAERLPTVSAANTGANYFQSGNLHSYMN